MKFKACPGFPAAQFQDVLQQRQWDDRRKHFSPVALADGELRSKRCEKEIAAYRRLCAACKQSKRVLYNCRWKYKKHPVPEDGRIMNSANRWLTTDDQQKKMAITMRKKKILANSLRQAAAKSSRMNVEMEKYRPKYLENRIAARSLVQHLDAGTSATKPQQCLWKNHDGNNCDHHADSGTSLCEHLRSTHLFQLLEENVGSTHLFQLLEENVGIDPAQRQYKCGWTGCRRIQPFKVFSSLRRHIDTHVASRRQQEKLSLLREQLRNVTRAPTGRRYSANTKRFTLKNYRSQRSWGRAEASSSLPVPSLRQVLKWKNAGDVESGLDEEVIKRMRAVTETASHLRHGILSFDEVYVNAQALVEAKSRKVFGYADDKPTELAKTVLVFQYISLFSKYRFIANVAWYGCAALDAAQMEKWLWDVMIALQRHGFRIHALVCDGSGVNRLLQKNLMLQAKRSRSHICEKYVIDHPLTADPEMRLFILSDPSHAVKKLRNCWYNRNMEFIGKYNRYPIRWSDLERVRDWQNTQARVDRRLTDKHLQLTTYAKMNVGTAVDVFSDPIEDALVDIDPVGVAGTCDFMHLGRELWLRTNDTTVYKDEESARKVIIGLCWLADQFSEWEAQTRTERDKFITLQTYDDVMLLALGLPQFMRYVWDVLSKFVPGSGFKPSVISQDPLEKTFSRLRQYGGGTQHITVKDIAYDLRTVNTNLLNASYYM